MNPASWVVVLGGALFMVGLAASAGDGQPPSRSFGCGFSLAGLIVAVCGLLAQLAAHLAWVP